MIAVKQAVKSAFGFFHELYDTGKFEDILLEEVALSEDRSAWLVTLGFYRRMPSVNIMESFGSKKYIRTQFSEEAPHGVYNPRFPRP